MHLINAKTYKLEYFVGAAIPEYAILSHVWGKEEVLFQDLSDLKLARKKEGFVKIELTCKQALLDGLQYAWVDTCCINKESSAELSEAINSMYRWYLRATRCYAYLSDLRICEDTMIVSNEEGHLTEPPLSESRWFTRGWTLQELIAPSEVYFYDRGWMSIGTKRHVLLGQISEITGIDAEVLKDSSLLHNCTVAKRMSWAANRLTTRKEDEAYCLLGIFNVNMPMLYGEEEGAFERLQHEIIRKTTDQSIFAHDRMDGSLFALSPRAFDACGDIMPCEDALLDDPYEVTNAGLRIKLPLINGWVPKAVLNCHRNYRRLVLLLEKTPHSLNIEKNLNVFAVIKQDVAVIPASTANALFAESQDLLILKHPLAERSRKINSQEPCWLWVYIGAWLGRPGLQIQHLWPSKCWDLAKPNMRSFKTEEDTYVTRIVKFSSSSAPSCGGILFSIRDHPGYIAAFFRLFKIERDQEYSHGNLHFFRLEIDNWFPSDLDAALDMHDWGETILLKRTTTYMNFNVESWTIEARLFTCYVNNNLDYTFEFRLKA